MYRGKVIRKYVADRAGEPYAAVAVEITGLDQREEVHCLGYATVFLPSRAMGRPALPVPHPERPEYVPFEDYGRAGWFKKDHSGRR